MLKKESIFILLYLMAISPLNIDLYIHSLECLDKAYDCTYTCIQMSPKADEFMPY